MRVAVPRLCRRPLSSEQWVVSFELLLYFYITKEDTTELMVILNSFNVVQFAHARHSSSKLALLSLNRKFQDLSAEKDKKRLAVRCWNEFSMTFGGICYLYSHFGVVKSILLLKNTHNSLLTAHCSKAQRRLEDAKPVRANSRGFLNPWNNWQDKEIASGRRGTATLTTDSRLCRRRYYVIVKYRGLESPRLFMFTSSRRFWVVRCE